MDFDHGEAKSDRSAHRHLPAKRLHHRPQKFIDSTPVTTASKSMHKSSGKTHGVNLKKTAGEKVAGVNSKTASEKVAGVNLKTAGEKVRAPKASNNDGNNLPGAANVR